MVAMRFPTLLASLALVITGCNALLDLSYEVSEKPSSVDGGADGTDGTPAKECVTNQDCIAKLGDFTVCRQQDSKCAKLLSPDCTQVVGDWKNDSAVILGSILPIVGVDKAGGIPLYNSIAVAVDDFKSGSNGLPPKAGSSTRRPIVVVGCSEESDDPNDVEAPIRSAKHLVDTVKVPAIIGASFSGNTLAVAEVTTPAGVLLMSPTATSVAITNLQDNGLVWRTAPSDVIQVQALVKLMPQIEASTRARFAMTSMQKLKVLILHKGDAYGKGLGAALQAQLAFNGTAALDNLNDGNLKVFDYGDSSSGAVDYNKTRQDVLTAFPPNSPPHVVFLLGTNEVAPEFLAKLETQWVGTKPTYLFPDGGLIPELWDAIGTNSELRARIFGTVPGTNNATYQLFRSRYMSFIKDGTTPDVGGTAASFDALYMLALAVAANPDKPVTGANIVEGLKRLVPPGTQHSPGSTNINAAFAILASGKNLDYVGASGPLDFDLATGEATSDIQIWCVPTEDKTPTGKAAAGTNSGIYFDAVGGTIAGPTLHPIDGKVKTTCNFP